jgi:hypothetical protein
MNNHSIAQHPIDRHSIDRQVFELVCPLETVAGAAQKEIADHAAPMFQAVIGEVLDGLAVGKEVYRIDLLEIDLGEVQENGFCLPDLLTRFREICTVQLSKLLRASPNLPPDGSPNLQLAPAKPQSVPANHQPAPADLQLPPANLPRPSAIFPRGSSNLPASPAATLLSPSDAQWEIARIFLLTGDLPWWVDKSLLPDMDELLKQIIDSNPDRLLSFLAQYAGSAALDRRIRGQFKKDTLQLLDRLLAGQPVPSVQPTPPTPPTQSAPPTQSTHPIPTTQHHPVNTAIDDPAPSPDSPDQYLSRAFRQKLALLLRNNRPTYGERYRSRALHRLVKVKGVRWLTRLQELKILPNHIFSQLEYIITAKGKTDKTAVREIATILRELSAFQLFFLLRIIDGPLTDPEKDVANPEKAVPNPEKDIPNPERAVANTPNERLVRRIMGQLRVHTESLHRFLLRQPEKELLFLVEKAARITSAVKELKQSRLRLLEHPRLLARWLLYIPIWPQGFAPGRKAAKSRIGPVAAAAASLTEEDRIWAQVRRAFGPVEWTTRERMTLEDVFHKGGFHTTDDKGILARCLRKLPATAIRLLQAITALREDEAKELLSSVSPVTTMEGKERDGEDTQRILVENAGLCLLAPYFSQFFKNLGYMKANQFKNSRYACKAIYLLQYIATGKHRAPEYLLPFNKLLCGLSPEMAIPGPGRLKASERAEADALAESVIANWSALKNTSVNGLRGSFLCRNGIIRDKGSNYVLQVERKEYDILLNGVSWTYTHIKLPWTDKYLQVEW